MPCLLYTSYSEFSRLMVFEPPYEEQVAMADYLETKVTEVDAIIEQKKEQDVYKRQRRLSLMKRRKRWTESARNTTV